MLTSNISLKKYRICGNLINTKNLRVESVGGIFDPVKSEKPEEFIMQVISKNQKTIMDITRLVGAKTKDTGDIPYAVAKQFGIPPGSKFIINEEHGPTVEEMQAQGKLAKSDVLKIAIELLDLLEKLHQNSFSLNYLSPGGIAFKNKIFQDIDKNSKKNQLILLNFSSAQIIQQQSDEADKQQRISTLDQIADVTQIPIFIKTLLPEADLTDFISDLSSLREPNYAKLRFLLKVILAESGVSTDRYYSWENSYEQKWVQIEEGSLETNYDEKEKGKRPMNHRTLLCSVEMFENQFSCKYQNKI